MMSETLITLFNQILLKCLILVLTFSLLIRGITVDLGALGAIGPIDRLHLTIFDI